MLLAGCAQVHVRVDERGQQRAAVALDDLGSGGGVERLAELGDLAVAHEHVQPGVDALAGIEDARSAHEHVGARAGRLDEPARFASAHAAASPPASRS